MVDDNYENEEYLEQTEDTEQFDYNEQQDVDDILNQIAKPTRQRLEHRKKK